MAIEAILFDADGVIQRPGGGGQARLAEVAGGDGNLDGLLADVFAAEDLCLEGTGDFLSGLSSVLARWNSEAAPEEVLSALNDIETDPGVLAMIASLRRRGLLCCLATNQQVHRARHMSAGLGYAHAFDREFYSCDLGAAKPARAFFEAILDAVERPPGRVLFIDDHEENVAAAKAMGLCGARLEPDSGARGLGRLLRGFGIDTVQPD